MVAANVAFVMLRRAALCAIKSFPYKLTALWDHNKDWTVLELISGIWTFMSSRDGTPPHKRGPVSLMWKHAKSARWWNQLKARRKKLLLTKTSKRGSCFIEAFVRLISGPRTAPLLLYSTVQDGNTDFQVNAVHKIIYDLSIYWHTAIYKHKDSSGLCQ